MAENALKRLGIVYAEESNRGLTHPFFSLVLNAFKEEAEEKATQIVDDARTEKETLSSELEGLRTSVAECKEGCLNMINKYKTLLENDLVPFETIVPISARLIANKAGYKFKNEVIAAIVKGLEEQIND